MLDLKYKEGFTLTISLLRVRGGCTIVVLETKYVPHS